VLLKKYKKNEKYYNQKKIIFVHFNRFLNKFDWERYELDLLSEKFLIEVHVLINIVHPHLKKCDNYSKSHNKNIIIFKDYNEWKSAIRNLKKNTLFIFQTFPYNFLALRIYYFIKIQKFFTSIMFMNNLPENKADNNNDIFFNKLIKKLLLIYYRPKHTFVFYKRKFIFFIFNYFPKTLSPDFCFSSGLNFKKFKFSKLIKINSWDFSRTFRKKKINKKNNSYILYLSDGESRYESDSSFYNAKRVENTKIYLKKLNSFFYKIEKKFKKKIIIASHPRGNPVLKHDKDLGGRLNYYGLTCELVKNAKFVIAQNSTSLSYAIIKKKPILFIYSFSEQKKNIGELLFVKNYSKLIKSQLINIDTFDNLDQKLLMNINIGAYRDFQKKYIISTSYTQNFLIFSKVFMKFCKIAQHGEYCK
jgi:hypothetical protein